MAVAKQVRKNPLVEIIAISTGCLNQCTYCKTKHARGELGSYPPDEIVERAVQAFQEGVVEVWLTSEDTGAYGRDIGSSLPELLYRLTDVIPDGCMLRLGMTNPPYILEHLEVKLLGHGNGCEKVDRRCCRRLVDDSHILQSYRLVFCHGVVYNGTTDLRYDPLPHGCPLQFGRN